MLGDFVAVEDLGGDLQESLELRYLKRKKKVMFLGLKGGIKAVEGFQLNWKKRWNQKTKHLHADLMDFSSSTLDFEDLEVVVDSRKKKKTFLQKMDF